MGKSNGCRSTVPFKRWILRAVLPRHKPRFRSLTEALHYETTFVTAGCRWEGRLSVSRSSLESSSLRVPAPSYGPP